MKVLIFGFGSIAKKHYQALMKIDPSAEVFAYRSQAHSEIIENLNSIYKTEDIPQNAPYDFVLISNPTFKHSETIELALRLNCPIFIEKPLFHNLDLDKVLGKIALSGIMTYVACNLRFLDSIIYTREILLPKIKINEVNVYCGSFLPEWRKGVDYKTVYSAHEDQGGGVHLDLIHELDYIYWFFGKPLAVSSHRRSKSTLAIDAIDYANYFLEYENFAVNVILNYYRKDIKRSIEIVGQDNTYYIDLCLNSVSSTNSVIFKSNQNVIDTYKTQLEYFISHLSETSNKENKLMNSVEEAFEVLKICLKS